MQFPSFDSNHMPPLISALWSRNYKVAEILIEGGASVRVTKRETNLGVILATVQAAKEKPQDAIPILELLIKKGANINQVTRDGCLPIHYTKDPTTKKLLKAKGSWDWDCQVEIYNDPDGEAGPEERYKLGVCLKGGQANSKLARQVNDQGHEFYKMQDYQSASGHFMAASYLDCQYLQARLNLAAVLSLEKRASDSVQTLEKAFSLDSAKTLSKIQTDPDFSFTKKSIDFKVSPIGRAYSQKYGASELTSAYRGTFPLKVAGDEINITSKEIKEGPQQEDFYFYLESKNRGSIFLFNSCRVHNHHYCTQPKKNYEYADATDGVVLRLQCYFRIASLWLRGKFSLTAESNHILASRFKEGE